MKDITLVFPGQGSQYVGMGKDLLEAQELYSTEELNSLDFCLPSLMIEGPEEKLQLTEFTQPSIVLHSTLMFRKLQRLLEDKGHKISRVLGHSVGEYSALVACGAMNLKDAVKAVHLRGKYMQEAVPVGVGAMFAIVRVPQEIVAQACNEVSSNDSQVMCANFNEPTQTVISGHKEACDKAVEWLKNNYEGKQMAIPLKVSAPFHSSLMKPAEEKLRNHLETIEIQTATIPYIANIDAKQYLANKDIVLENLTKQVCASVLWSQSISTLPEESLFIEVGPGKVLTGLNKKINKTLKTITLDSESGFQELEELL